MGHVRIDIDSAFTSADRDGWVNLRCPISSFESDLRLREVVLKSNRRRGSADAEILRPRNEQDARKGSMSATVGTGPQPLHTDGAHLVQPPRYIVLACGKSTAVPTKLLRISKQLDFADFENARHGVFSTRDGKSSFWSHALSERDGWRFDPLCMLPQDQRARDLVARVQKVSRQAVSFAWTPGDCLLIDNRNVLHGRADSTAEPERELKRLTIEVAP